ncbi:hypothetical protein SAMN04489707_10445 [Paenacidovorax caeni]|uniref:Uncharacterized protein n=1 Tax=Paenacidovorax caeni TaxID=343013 RepID=A0A1I7KAZ4_9BURK|nr:hypothetical protein [Paenacidovorax caeni]SFU94606.1 hypothetical protein SAMN04489707_10445 [Paenacidovorax caeni]
MNNISSFAHHAQARLQAVVGASGTVVKRSHIYELMAAALGLGSHAALKAQGLLCPLPSQPLLAHYGTLHPGLCAARAEALGVVRQGCEPLAAALCTDMAAQALGLVPWEDILSALLSGNRELYRETLRDDAYYEVLETALDNDPNAWPDDPEPLRLDSSFVLQSLKTAAGQGEGRAHLALGLLIERGIRMNCDLHEDDEADEVMDELSDSHAGLYWYERQQKGEVLKGVELEWAQGYVERVKQRAAASREQAERCSSARDHFNAAAALGQHDALLVLADRYGDSRFFDLQAPRVLADPVWIADLAQRVGRYEWTPAWLTVAAERGDMRALRELIETWHADDPLKAWTWFHFAKLLGKDLTQDDYRAIHEDGSSYDDDVGGTMFVDGVDGVELPAVEESVRQQALQAAQILAARLQAE